MILILNAVLIYFLDDFPTSVSQWQYPHLVFITNRYSLSCIGSLIWDDFVLTVAECITRYEKQRLYA